jgi:hypothetical protein
VAGLAAALAATAVASLSALALEAPVAHAGTIYLNACSHLGDRGNDTDVDGAVWSARAAGAYTLYNRCPQNGSFQIATTTNPHRGDSAQWATVTPPSIQIVHAWTPANDVLTDRYLKSDGFQARFFWNGGSQDTYPTANCCGGMWYGAGINRSLGPSRWFGFQVICSSSLCSNPPGQLLNVSGVQLEGVDTTPPGLVALGEGNLWYEGSRYVRGAWPTSFQASDETGICGMQATVDGQTIPGPSDPSPNQHSWTQCPDPETMDLSIDTASYPDGPLSLSLAARDATSPANVATASETLRIDNQPVTLSLNGPTDAPTSAGTQYISATATAGASGVAGISCSLDGGPYSWHPGASAQIPVSGLGRHQLVCTAQNASYDSSGQPASSPNESWGLSIRQATVLAIGFHRVIDKLRCRRARVRVRVPGRWVTIHRHHKRIRIHKRPRTKLERVTRCHPRTALKRVVVLSTSHRDGHTITVKHVETIRVVLLPHVVSFTERRVAHGAGTTVSGWLGTSTGTALGGQRVIVRTAADNQLGRFHTAAVVTTAANGGWSARIGPGPSRLIEAVYAGAALTEPTTSPRVRLVVPSKVTLHVDPTRARWGQTIRIFGRVLGGYIPQGKLLRLRIGVGGVKGTVGIPDITPDGRFHTAWTFASGTGTVRYWFAVSTLDESSYAYAPSSSRRVYVTVGT